jgi:hypothetical protein
MPWYVIFGHTHQPIPWGHENAQKAKPLQETGMRSIALFNTGGWLKRLNENNEVEFCGAEVFTYSADKGFNSVPIG